MKDVFIYNIVGIVLFSRRIYGSWTYFYVNIVMKKVSCLIVISLLAFASIGFAQSQEVAARHVPVMNFDELETYLKSQKEKLIVVNFWATWCGPCVEELHYFEYANRDFKNQDVKVILVSLDFKKAMNSQLIPFLKLNEIESEVILLSDPKTNTWINRVAPKWSGAIPGTWFITGESSVFEEGKYSDYQVLKNTISTLKKI